VEEMLERRRHVAEPGRAAEHEARAFGEVGDLDVRSALVRYRRLAGDGDRRDRRHAAQARGHARHLADPACDQPRELGDLAVAAVVEDEDFGHGRPWTKRSGSWWLNVESGGVWSRADALQGCTARESIT